MTEILVAFCERLRELGLGISTSSQLDYTQALAALGVETYQQMYWAGRTTLVHRPEDVAAYNQAFGEFWPQSRFALQPVMSTEAVRAVPEPQGEGEEGSEPGSNEHARYSDIEVLRHSDLATCTDEELREAYRLIRTLRLEGPPKTTRRLERSLHHRGEIDIRRTIKRTVRRDGEILDFAYRRRRKRRRRVLVFFDVSGSMDNYLRALFRFAHAAVAGRSNVEVFSLGTRLTRLTRELSHPDLHRALASVSGVIEDYSGGTRLGVSLKQFNEGVGLRGLARGAVVVIISDGIDQGNPELLAQQLDRLRLVANRIIWVNPLKASPGYQPLSRGMVASLPFVDAFVEGHSVAALADLSEEVRRASLGLPLHTSKKAV